MPDDIIPNDVKQFIQQYLDSIAQWEGLLLMRSEASAPWGVDALAQRLYIAQPEAAKILEKLLASGFLQQVSVQTYVYAAPAPLDATVHRTALLYQQYLIPITHLIHSKSKNRIQAFADAFRIRKDK